MKEATLAEHRSAVISLARHRAKKAVQHDLKAQGLRVSLIPPAQIRPLADAYLAANRDRLMAEAKKVVNTSPLFARWRYDEPEFLEK